MDLVLTFFFIVFYLSHGDDSGDDTAVEIRVLFTCRTFALMMFSEENKQTSTTEGGLHRVSKATS